MQLLRYILYFLILLPSTICAQNTGSYWFFNDSLGLNFNKDSFKMIYEGVTNTKEGTSVICESDSLVLYTDGVTVWDKTHTEIENGTDLFGDHSSIQSSIILKQSDSFYVLTVDASLNEKVLENKGICYSVIVYDSLINKFKITSKNISLGIFSNEAITAKKSASFDGYWIIFPEYNTKDIHVYKLDKTGLSFYNKQSVLPFNHIGKSQVKISAKGNYLSLLVTGIGGSYELCVFNFDNATGAISDYRSIQNFVSYGMEFSPNEEFLYIQGYSTRSLTDNVKAGIYQVWIDSIKPSTTLSSVNSKLIHETSVGSVMSVTPSSQIFLAHSDVGGKALSAILKPDSLGLKCKFKPSYIYFNDRPYNSSIPNICIDYILQPYFEVQNGCIDSAITLRLIRNRADSVTWIFGDGYSTTNTLDSSGHVFKINGNYNVSVICYYPTYADTISKKIEILTIKKPSLGNDTLLCFSEEITFEISDTLSTLVVWNNTDTSRSFIASESQNLFVKSSNEHCSAFDTISLSYIDCTVSIDSLCYGDSTVFEVKASNIDSVTFRFDDGKHKTTTQKITKHLYSSYRDYQPIFSLYLNGLSRDLADTITIIGLEGSYLLDSIIECEPLQLAPELTQYDYTYTWNTGATTRELNVNESGTYSLILMKNGCSVVDSCFVAIGDCECPIFIPNSFTPNSDNLNDNFTLFSECDLDEISLNIYTRWGEQIIKNTSSWDGKYQGLTCPNGVYVWTVSFRDKNNQTQHEKGTVHLVR